MKAIILLSVISQLCVCANNLDVAKFYDNIHVNRFLLVDEGSVPNQSDLDAMFVAELFNQIDQTVHQVRSLASREPLDWQQIVPLFDIVAQSSQSFGATTIHQACVLHLHHSTLTHDVIDSIIQTLAQSTVATRADVAVALQRFYENDLALTTCQILEPRVPYLPYRKTILILQDSKQLQLDLYELYNVITISPVDFSARLTRVAIPPVYWVMQVFSVIILDDAHLYPQLIQQIRQDEYNQGYGFMPIPIIGLTASIIDQPGLTERLVTPVAHNNLLECIESLYS